MRTAAVLLLVCLAAGAAPAADPTYWQDVRPVLRKHCTVCHNKRTLPEVEVSGGLDLTSVRAYAETGADYLSIGALTHSAPALDLSLEIEDVG